MLTQKLGSVTELCTSRCQHLQLLQASRLDGCTSVAAISLSSVRALERASLSGDNVELRSEGCTGSMGNGGRWDGKRLQAGGTACPTDCEMARCPERRMMGRRGAEGEAENGSCWPCRAL